VKSKSGFLKLDQTVRLDSKLFSDSYTMISWKKYKYLFACVTIFIITISSQLFSTKSQLPSYQLETINLPVIPEEIKSVLKQRSLSSPLGKFSAFYATSIPGPNEKQINEIFLHLFKQSQCALNKLPTFIVDVGLNAGYYSLLASTYDCFHVISLDPQLLCHQLYRFSRSKNNFKNKWNSYHNAAWFKPITLTTQRHVCDAGYSLNMKHKTVPQSDETDIVQSISIDSLPELQLNSSTNILLMKIDTEGAEIGILLGCQKLIETNRIDNFIIEVMNHRWPMLMKKDFANFEEMGIKVFSDLQKNYEAILLADAAFSSEIIAWSSSSPPKSNPISGFSAIIPEGPKGFPVLLENRKRLIKGCNIWFRRKT